MLALVRSASVQFSAPPDVPHLYHESSNFLYVCGERLPDALLLLSAQPGRPVSRALPPCSPSSTNAVS